MSIAAADEALRRLTPATWVQWRIEAAGHRLFALGLAGRFAELDVSIPDASRVAEEIGHVGALIGCDFARSFTPLLRSGDLPGIEAWAEGTLTTWAAAGPWGHAQQFYRAISQAERGDRELALAICIRARLAFPPDNQWTGQIDGCELWCMALLDRADWPARYSERQHLMPTPDVTAFGGRRWFAIFLLLAQVTRGDLAAAAALYPVLRQILDDGWRVGPLQPVEGLVGLAAAAGGNWDVAEGHFRSALAFVDEAGDRLGKPSVQKWYAWMLLRRNAPGDRAQARELLDDAIASFRTIGMTLSLGDAETLRASLDG